MSVVVSGVLSVAEFASETAAEEVALSLDATELVSEVALETLSVAEFASETAAEEVALSLDATELVSEVALETLSDVVDVAETADEFAVVVEVEFCSCFEQAVRDNVTATAQSNAVSLFFINTILSLNKIKHFQLIISHFVDFFKY